MKKISQITFFILCLLCFALNGCRKTNVSETRGVLTESNRIPFFENIPEIVEEEPDEVEESDPYEYEPETATATKVTAILSAKDTYTHSGCDAANNKYKNYTVLGGDGFEMIWTLSKPDTIVSIATPSGFYTMSTVPSESTTTEVTVVNTGVPTPVYKARNTKFVVTFQNGKKTNVYIKTIPYFSGNMYGDAKYHVAYTLITINSAKYSIGMTMGTPAAITSDWLPAICDVIHYGSNHYGVISNAPVLVNTKINGVTRSVWKFKIKERNSRCDFKATTKTVKWWSGQKLPSAGISRDSAYQFWRSS